MDEKLLKICDEIFQDETEAQKFLALESADDMYNYFSQKTDVSEEEFDKFIGELLEYYPEDDDRISDDLLEDISGGGIIDTGKKWTAGLLATMSLVGGAGFSGASATNVKGGSPNRPAASVSSVIKQSAARQTAKKAPPPSAIPGVQPQAQAQKQAQDIKQQKNDNMKQQKNDNVEQQKNDNLDKQSSNRNNIKQSDNIKQPSKWENGWKFLKRHRGKFIALAAALIGSGVVCYVKKSGQNSLKAAEGALTDAVKKSSELEEETRNLKKELSEKSTSVAAQEKKVKELEDEMKKLRGDLDETTSELEENLRKKSEEARLASDQLKEARNEKEQLRKELESVRSEHEEYVRRQAEQRRQGEETARQKAELEGKVNAERREGELGAKVAELEEQVRAKERELQNLTAQEATAKANCETISGQLRQLETQKAEAEKHQAAEGQRVQAQEVKKAEELATLRQQLKDEQEKLKDAEADKSTVQQKLAATEAELKAANKTALEQQAAVTAMEAAKKQAEETASKATAEQQKTKKLLEASKETLEKTKEEVQQVKRDLDEAKRNLEQATKDKAELEGKIADAARQHKDDLKNKLAEKQREKESEIEAYKGQISNMASYAKGLVGNYERTMNELMRINDEAQRSGNAAARALSASMGEFLKTIQSQYADVMKAKDEQQKLAENARDDLAKVREETAKLRAEFAAKEGEAKSLREKLQLRLTIHDHEIKAESLAADIKALEAELNAKDDQIRELENARDEAEKARKMMETTNVGTQRALGKNAQEMESLRNKVSELESIVAAKETVIAELRGTARLQGSTAISAKESLGQKEFNMQQLTADRDSLKRQLDEAKKQSEKQSLTHEERIKKLELELSQEKEQHLKDVKAQQDERDKERAEATQKYNDAIASASTGKDEAIRKLADDKDKEIENLRKQLAEQKQLVSEKDTTITALQAEARSREGTLEMQKTESSTYKQLLSALGENFQRQLKTNQGGVQKLVEDFKSRLMEKGEETAKAQAANASLEMARSRIAADLQRALQEKGLLQTKLDGARLLQQQSDGQYKLNTEYLGQQLKQEQTQKTALESELRRVKNELNRLKRERGEGVRTTGTMESILSRRATNAEELRKQKNEESHLKRRKTQNDGMSMTYGQTQNPIIPASSSPATEFNDVNPENDMSDDK